MLRKTLKWIIYLLLFLVIIFSVGTYFLLKNEDNITKIIKNKLNAHLIVPVNTSQIKVSLVKKIPYIAVEFNDVWALSPFHNDVSDTLFSIKRAYILLDIFKTLSGELQITRLYLQDGFLNLYVDPFGKVNYIIWKDNGQKNDKEYQINLNDISFQNIKLNYKNIPNELTIQTLLNNVKINGDVSHDNAIIRLRSHMFINDISRGNIKYVNNGNTFMNVIFNKKGKVLKYEEGNIKINRQRVETSGLIDWSNGNLNILIDGRNLKFDSNENIFNLSSKLTSYARITGIVYTLVKLSGNFRNKNQLDIQTSFNLSNGNLAFKKQRLKYSLHYLKGSFKSDRKIKIDILSIDSIYFTGNGDTVSGDFRISNFEDPTLSVRSNASINAGNINLFFNNQNDISFKKGRLNLKWYTSDISLSDEELWKIFIQNTKNTSIKSMNITFSLPRLGKEIDMFKSDLYLNKSLNINRISFFMKEMDITLKGYISNFLNLINNKNTWIDLKTYSDKLDLFKLLDVPDEEEDQKNTLPQHIFLKSETFVESLIIDDVTYNNAHTEIYYKPGLATLKVFNSEVFDGNLKGNCALGMTSNNEKKLAVLAETKNVDITKMFKAYKEFGQNFITSKNLKGKIDANISFRSDLTEDFKIDTKSVLSNSSITIRKGELLEHEPMYSLSKYIKLEELKHIYFADLSNEIFIKDQCVIIPQMQINSSAMDIEVSGKHYFDNRIEYMMNIYVSDLLAKKVSRNKQNENNFTYIQRSNNKHFKIPLIMKGTTTDYEIEINKKQARENFAQSVQKEKQEIKSVLKQEFKIFSKQPTDTIKKSGDSDIRLKFEEITDDKQNKKQEKEKEEKSENTELKFEWDE